MLEKTEKENFQRMVSKEVTGNSLEIRMAYHTINHCKGISHAQSNKAAYTGDTLQILDSAIVAEDAGCSLMLDE